MRELVRWLVIALAIGAEGCDACGSAKPYTPFGVASSVPAANVAPPPAPSASEAPASPDGPRFEAKKAVLAPASSAQRWQLEGLDLVAPEARAFAQALIFDADADQRPDALTWTLPAANVTAGAPGELWFFRGGAPPIKVFTLPGFVPTGPGCQLDAKLSQTGPRTATIDVAAVCQAALLARAPARAVSVIAPATERPRVLTLRVAPAAPGEALTLAVDSADQDGDGRDDVRLLLTVGKQGSAETASAELSFFDRAAGVSRNAAEPSSSLGRFASRETVRAKSKKNAPSVLERVDGARRLYATLCAESGTARVFDEDNNPIRCGNLEKVVDHLAAAEQAAALTNADLARAASVLARDGWYVQGVSAAQKKQLERDLFKALTRRDLKTAMSLAARPKIIGKAQLSPLWFQGDGELLIQTAAGLMRVARDGSETPLDSDATAPWPLDLVAPSGLRLVGLVDSCDRSEIALSVADASGPKASMATAVLAPRPGSCAAAGRIRPRFFAPVAFLDSGLEAFIGGMLVRPAPSATAPVSGGARSPDGRVFVSPHPLGLLVTGEQKELWTVTDVPELNTPDKFESCVIANAASAIACVVSGRARLFLRPE